MECHYRMGQKVLPVFYHVDPSDVRKQKGKFGIAFQEHENKFSGGKNELNKWREALTAAANLSGYHISPLSGGESAPINKIVQEVLSDKQARRRENHLVGMDSHIHKLVSYLRLDTTKEVRSIGIHGMGGVGKTTIARSLFKRIAYKFDGSSFVKDVRENSYVEKDMCALQKKILKDILAVNHEFMIHDQEDGADMIQERLCNKKVLLVLDDVDNVNQLEFLAATHEWFGPGSRIIITTRDERLLSHVNAKYEPPLLIEDQALVLFSKHAFLINSPPKGYEELSKCAIRHTGRLPLAVKVLGSFFRGRKADVWESALDRLAKTPNNEIFKTLKLSFDGLEESEKKIFLDIACFYKGREVEYVTKVLGSFDFYPEIGISSLIEKSLLTVSNRRICMHELLQEMGWQIALESGQDSRLWEIDVIYDFIKKRKNLNRIEALVAPRKKQKHGAKAYDEKLGFNKDVFKTMKNLRLLDIEGKFTSSKPTILPDELRWLCWNKYPFSSLPLVDNPKLVGLEMEFGKIKYLWKGKKMMQNLRFIQLYNMDFLKKLPDVSGAPNVESLIMSGCTKLVKVDESLGHLKRLVHLDMSGCENLRRLPSRMELESLKTLILSYCESLRRFPELSECMVKLSHIDLSCCDGIYELPTSIKYASNLSYLNLDSCRTLRSIPDSICELKRLVILRLYRCSRLRKLPDGISSMEKLEELHIGDPRSINFLPIVIIPYNLKVLRIDYHYFHAKFKWIRISGLKFLKILVLYSDVVRDRFPKLSESMGSLSHIDICCCDGIEEVKIRPSSIEYTSILYLNLDPCSRLESIQNSINLRSSWDLEELLQERDREWLLEELLMWIHRVGCPGLCIPHGTFVPSQKFEWTKVSSAAEDDDWLYRGRYKYKMKVA